MRVSTPRATPISQIAPKAGSGGSLTFRAVLAQDSWCLRMSVARLYVGGARRTVNRPEDPADALAAVRALRRLADRVEDAAVGRAVAAEGVRA